MNPGAPSRLGIHLGPNLVAGLTLAAIGIPEQMATAQLAGLKPEIGLIAFVAAAIGFAIFSFNRVISVGADSTIAPIFASGLVAFAALGSPQYAILAITLAFVVGAILVIAGRFGLGWIADLFSIPVTTGFLAGIAVHIAISQLPQALGLPPEDGTLLHRLRALSGAVGATNPFAVGISLGVLAISLACEQISPRIPGVLIGLLAASLAATAVGAHAHGLSVLGALHPHLPTLVMPSLKWSDTGQFVALALIVAVVIMLQTAATVRSFGSLGDSVTDISQTFIGVGAANVLAGLAGTMPVNASPPRTAAISQSGGTSQISSLLAALVAVLVVLFGGQLLGDVPNAALAGILLFIAVRIVRVQAAISIFRQTRAEFSLIVATMVAIVVLPLELGIAAGIILSLLHGMWTTSQTHVVEYCRIPGTSIWWAPGATGNSERVEGVLVLAFQAPLSFLNAYEFRREFLQAMKKRPVKVVVLEGNGISEIDYTAAQILSSIIDTCRTEHVELAVARLESLRANTALEGFALLDKLGRDRLFRTVDEAVKTLDPKAQASARGAPQVTPVRT